MAQYTNSATAADERLDSFEFPQSSSSSTPKKAKRQTAFYPNMNSTNKLQKPFSRSAAKRESVMALGSIEHLQHYFTKTGLSAKNNSLVKTKGFIPAIGGPEAHPSRPSLGSIHELHLPPSPEAPTFSRPLFPPTEKTYETDPENLKPGVIKDLESVSASWGLTDASKLDGVIDVLALLKLTTQLIRSVRNYMLSLPDEAASTLLERAEFRPRSLQPMPAKQRVVSNPNLSTDPLARIRRSALEVLTVLRALEERARLPLSDEAYDAMSDRVSSQNSLSPEPIHAMLPDDEQRRAPAAAGTQAEQIQEQRQQRRGNDIHYAIISVPGRSEAIRVWDDDDDIFSVSDAGANEKREIWDERLVLGGGWLYRQDIHLADLAMEQDMVGAYLSAVDEVLFDGTDARGRRGWERTAEERIRAEEEREEKKSRRTSLGKRPDDNSPARDRVVSENLAEAMGRMMIVEGVESPDHSDAEDGVEDNELPDWAKRNAFDDTEDPLARLHALLSAFLPSTLLPLLPSSYTAASRFDLLTVLSSGQLLCVAYNSVVRRSRKPWGFINKDSIHDIATLELQASSEDKTDPTGDAAVEKRKTGWTFRRIDNLRLWAAALKLRYLIPLTTSPAPVAGGVGSLSPSRSTPRNSTVGIVSTVHNKNSSTRTDSKPVTPTDSPVPSSSLRLNEASSILFDAKAIARHNSGWEEMLEMVSVSWVHAVIAEKRKAR